MIRNVRRKFILLAMIAICVCTMILVAMINLVNYYQVDQDTTTILQSIAENNGKFPDFYSQNNGKNSFVQTDGSTTDQTEEFYRNVVRPPFSLELQYETRYFVVRIEQEGITYVDLAHIATVDDSSAREMTAQIQEIGKKIGYLDNYKYYISRVDQDGSTLLVVMDCESRLSSISSLAMTSIVIALIGIFAMFLFITMMSKRVIRPVIESMEKQKQFITDASHELKTPLTVIATNMDVLTMDIGKNEWVTGTQKQVSNLRKLVNHLVSLSRLEEENTILICEKFDLSRAVAETAEPFASMAEYEGKIFDLHIEQDVELVGDENAIRQLTAILCDNAVKYASEKGNIELRLEKHGKKIHLNISNTCEEMVDETSLHRLFDRFYRADASRSKENGKTSYGIGLAIAKAVVEKHGGRITVEQERDKKITFKVLFS